MKTIKFGQLNGKVSVIAAGCMRIAGMTEKEADVFVKGTLETGINFFDHADIYGKGKSEEIFGKVLSNNPSLRDKMYIQTKCGIRDGMFDFSKEHIIEAVEGSLLRLKTDYIDSLLLHRPDVLMEPGEIQEAFTKLRKEGKVLNFGVSNMNRYQMDLFRSGVGEKIVANHMQLSIAHTPIIDAGFNINMRNESSIMRDGGTLEYLRMNDIVMQAWSPLQTGMFGGVFIGKEGYEELTIKMRELAEKYEVSIDAIAYAWILRLPMKVQVITGTTKVDRLKKAAESTMFTLTRSEWYDLYRAAGNMLP